MPNVRTSIDIKSPGTVFCIGLAAMLLSLVVSIEPVWDTFMYGWRAEFLASIFLMVAASAFYYSNKKELSRLAVTRDELRLLILPVCAFIIWSALSIVWAASWKSAAHHTLVWCQYLLFYVLVRQLLNRGRSYGKLATTLGLTLAFFGVLAVLAYCTLLLFGTGSQIGIVYAKYGEQVNTIFPLLLVGVLRLSGRSFIRGALVLTLLWMIVFCSLSRTNVGLFAISMAVMAVAVFAIKRFRRYRIKFAVVGLCFVLAPVPFQLFSMFAGGSGVLIAERVSDSAGINSSNDFRKLMITLSGEMIAAHPIVGVGADNFGFEVNGYRARYASQHPDDPHLAQAEGDIPERAHNEYLQIFAELGVVGFAIFAWFLLGIAVLGIRAARRFESVSLYHVAALLGLAMFLASSLVTSYSFRLVQNGFVFFFVLAVAAKLLAANETQGIWARRVRFSPRQIGLGYSAGMAACLLMTGFCIVRVSSVMYATNANYTPNIDDAIPLYETAMRLDGENADAPYFLGLRLVEEGRYAEAVPYLQNSIRIGRAPSADFSYLASAQSLAGDNEGAERTFEEAATLYPRSPFVLTRYAALLKANGRIDHSREQFARAVGINSSQANTWWTVLTESPLAASGNAFKNKNYAEVMDLKPESALYAVKAERDIRFPEEKMKF